MSEGEAWSPPEVLLLPSLPLQLDAQGRPVAEEAQLLLARTPEGVVVAQAYTTPERLAASLGEMQPWVALRIRDLADVLERNGVDVLFVDAGHPDAYTVEPDGTVQPLADFASSTLEGALNGTGGEGRQAPDPEQRRERDS